MGVSFYDEWEKPEFEDLANIAENLVYRLPGCTDVMIRKTIASVYRDFCKRTCVLKGRRRIELSRDQRCYSVCSRSDGFIVDCVIGVTFENGRELCEGEYSLHEGKISFPDRVLPNCHDRQTVEVEFVEIPELGSEKIPLGFLNRYGDAIASGVLMQLMSMAGRPWSDPQQAALEARLYENALTEFRVRHHSGGQMSSGKLNFMNRGLTI